MGERTEQPTAKRLSQARRRGQIARSADAASAVFLLIAVIIALNHADDLLASLKAVVAYTLSEQSLGRGVSTGALAAELSLLGAEAAKMILPAAVVLFVTAALTGFAQVGVLFTNQPLQPKFSRLNPIAGLGRFFSRRHAVKSVTDLAKFAVIAGMSTWIIVRDMPEVAAAVSISSMQGFVQCGRLVADLAIWILIIMLILGVIDFAYQKWQHRHDLRMTRHEVQEERRASEGDPKVKGRQMRLARTIAMQRLQKDVPGADVVVTNPTHFSVALKYDGASMRAPRVVAKGADYLALKIRYIAAEHGIPIVERPPLARALYASVDAGREIPAEHYEAVAEVLAYVYRLETQNHSSTEPPARPVAV